MTEERDIIFHSIRELRRGIHRSVERIVDKPVDSFYISSIVTILYRFA